MHVIEEDDGSGWVKVADETGGKGLVPATYIEITEEEEEAPKKPPPPAVPSRTKPKAGLGNGQYGASQLS